MNLPEKEKKDLMKFLKSQRLMALATYDGSSPWVCTVYFAVDHSFNFYFCSSPKSDHSKFIEKNNKVGCAIFDSHTPNSAKKTGVQFKGRAKQVEGWDRTKILLKMWNKAAPGMEEIVNVKNMMNKVISSRVYEIKPQFIKFFSQELFPDEEYREFRF